MKKYFKSINFLWLSGLLFLSCESFVQIDPPQSQIVGTAVFSEPGTVRSALAGMYTRLRDQQAGILHGSSSGLGLLAAYYTDELDFLGQVTNHTYGVNFYTNQLFADTDDIASIWATAYAQIYLANSIIEGVKNATQIPAELSSQAAGEARFVRAMLHFYLTNLFGDVPYVETTNYEQNRTTSRLNLAIVYQKIIDDLKQAAEELSETYPSAERVRPNRAVAEALLARVYLYNQDWENAILYANKVINRSSTYQLAEIGQVFKKNSNGTIWSLITPTPTTGLHEGRLYVVVAEPAVFNLRSELLESFEVGDLRKEQWIGNYMGNQRVWTFPFKYTERTSLIAGGATEYAVVMRIEEQHLIRAEALAQMGNLEAAKEDLDRIRHRAGLSSTVAQTKEAILNAVLKERQLEFFVEYGHRFFDLKRSGKATSLLMGVKSNWNEVDLLWPIPEKELLANPNLLPQNNGY